LEVKSLKKLYKAPHSSQTKRRFNSRCFPHYIPCKGLAGRPASVDVPGIFSPPSCHTAFFSNPPLHLRLCSADLRCSRTSRIPSVRSVPPGPFFSDASRTLKFLCSLLQWYTPVPDKYGIGHTSRHPPRTPNPPPSLSNLFLLAEEQCFQTRFETRC